MADETKPDAAPKAAPAPAAPAAPAPVPTPAPAPAEPAAPAEPTKQPDPKERTETLSRFCARHSLVHGEVELISAFHAIMTAEGHAVATIAAWEAKLKAFASRVTS